MPKFAMLGTLFSIGSFQILIILVNMGRTKVLSIMLGPTGFGIVATIDQIVLSVAKLSGFALPFIAIKLLSYAHSESHKKFQVAYSSFLSGILGLSVGTTVILLGLLVLKPDFFGADIVPYLEFLNLALISVPAIMLGTFFVNTLAAGQKSAQSAYLNFLVTFCIAIAACLGVAFGGILGLYVATIGAGLMTSIGTVLYIRKTLNVKVIDKSAGLIKEIKRKPEIASMALVLHIALSSYFVAMMLIRLVVLSKYGEEYAGFLQALLSISLALGAISASMNGLFLIPLMNRALPLKDKLKAAHDFQGTVTLVLSVIALPALLFPELGIYILFSSEFLEISNMVFLFILWQSLYQMVNVYQQLLIGLDDINFITISTTIGYLIVMVICSPLVAEFELQGVAIALIIGMVITGLLISYRLKTKFNSGIPYSLWLRMLSHLAVIMMTGFFFNQIDEWTLQGVIARIGFSFLYFYVLWLSLSTEQKKYTLKLREKLRF